MTDTMTLEELERFECYGFAAWAWDDLLILQRKLVAAASEGIAARAIMARVHRDADFDAAVDATPHPEVRASRLCDTTMTERFEKFPTPPYCCGTYKLNLGPCKVFHPGAISERCVYCDHTLECHNNPKRPSRADAASRHGVLNCEPSGESELNGSKPSASAEEVEAAAAAEYLEAQAVERSKIAKMLADDKSARNRAAGDEGARYDWVKPEQTTEYKAATLLRKQQERIEEMERWAGKVECIIATRTVFTGDPPYVGWKGLSLALHEALDARDAAQAREAKRVALLERAQRELNDWVVTFADTEVSKQSLEEAWERIGVNGGTIAYVADILQDIRAALAEEKGE